jgi:ParB-like chromosome segregation protein Spo0J
MPRSRSTANTKDNFQVLRLDQLVLMHDLQVRVALNPDTVRDYERIFREVPEEKCTCPPLLVYLHQGSYVVADGFHRVTAARKAGRTTLNAFVHTGSLDDAWMQAVNHNLRHGMQYTRADRQKIVNWFLDHERYGKLSARDIAALTGNMVPHSTIANIRKRRKLQVLEEASKLDMDSPRQPTLADQVQQVRRAHSRLSDAAAIIFGVAKDVPDAPPSLGRAVLAARQAFAQLAQIIEDWTAETEEDMLADDNDS